MVSVVIIDNGEPNVIRLTFENLYGELKDIYGSELLIRDRWFDLEGVKNKFVCFVEADCLVSKGYFKTLLGDFMRKGSSRTEAVISSATAVNYWDNLIYGYATSFDNQGVYPNRESKSTNSFAVQIAYIPGAIIRVGMLKPCLKDMFIYDNLVRMSAELSMSLWERAVISKGKGGFKVYLNPKVTYLTTENYVNDIGKFDVPVHGDVVNIFSRESI